MTVASAILSCTVLGLQHGIDVDHVAAISDVTRMQANPREAARSGLLYAAGHAATVGVLGVVFIVMRLSIPSVVAPWMQRIIGFTLVLLAIYVLRAAFTGVGPVGRGGALLAMIKSFRRDTRKTVPATSYGRGSSLSLGVLHGVGAETPTQLSVLLIAANMDGPQNGLLGLSIFAAGMFVSNMALTTATAGIFQVSKSSPQVFRWLGVLTSLYSLWIGIALMAH